jgi:hypothetical protein
VPKELSLRVFSELLLEFGVLALEVFPKLEVLQNLNFLEISSWNSLFKHACDLLERL